MFYVCTIKHIVDKLICYPDVSKIRSFRHFKDFADAVADVKIQKIVGYFSTPRLHPLMESDRLKNKILAILNANNFGIEFVYNNSSHIKE